MGEPSRNFAQMTLDVFNGKDPGGVLWQPRIDFWYAVNKKRGTLPPHLQDASLIDLYDYCYASIRYWSFPLKVRYKNVQKIVEMFYPHLALGISDEIPPDGDIERVRMIGAMVQEMKV